MAASYARLDKDQAAVLFVDHQAGLLSLVRDIDPLMPELKALFPKRLTLLAQAKSMPGTTTTSSMRSRLPARSS